MHVRDMGSIPGLGRSPGRGCGNPLKYSCLENPVIRGAWWPTVPRVAESDTNEGTEHTHAQLGVRLCILFPMAAVSKAKISSRAVVFVFPTVYGFTKGSLNKDLRLAVLNLHSPVITQEPYLVVTRCGGGEALI